jgi:hypothetical protein
MLVNKSTLQAWNGEPLGTIVTAASVHYRDGRVEEIAVAPYLMLVKYPASIEYLWNDADLDAIGLVRAVPATLADGMQFVGEPRFERDGEVVREVRDVEPLPPPPDTVTITREEHDRLVAEAEKWRTGEMAVEVKMLDAP